MQQPGATMYNVRAIAQSKTAQGFSLIELMISLAIISILAVVGLPAYQGYVETTNMAKVNDAYQHAVRAAQQEFSKDTARISLGFASTLPADEAGWIDVFDAGDKNAAPGGGLLYVTDASSSVDRDLAGAINVTFNLATEEVEIVRPSYLSLIGFSATISRTGLDVAEVSP